MVTFELIMRILSIALVTGISVFGIAAIYLNVFEPWKNRNMPRKPWDIHAK